MSGDSINLDDVALVIPPRNSRPVVVVDKPVYEQMRAALARAERLEAALKHIANSETAETGVCGCSVAFYHLVKIAAAALEVEK